jgi:hypothetical protein
MVLPFCRCILVALAFGCGSRTPLSDFERAQPDPPVPDAACPGLQPGAAAPISGYCSDRAGRAVHALPTAPALLASLATDSVSGSEPLVDERGRVFFAIDTDATDSAVLANRLIAVDSNASLAASVSFEGTIGAFAIAADGTLRVVDTTWAGGIERHVSRVTRDGAVLERRRLPDDAGFAFAVGPEGNLVFTPTGAEDAGRVVVTSTQGELLWRSEPLDGWASRAAIARDGRVIVSASRGQRAEIIALDGATGQLAWRFEDVGYAGQPAITPDGSARVSLAAPDLASQELLALEADGSLRFRTALPGEAVTVSEATCVDRNGRSYVRTRGAVVSVDAAGGVLFVRSLHPNGPFSCAVDPSGILFYASLGFAAVDGQSGDLLWSLADGFMGSPPGTLYYAGPVVLAGDRSLVLMDHGGSVHWLGD